MTKMQEVLLTKKKGKIIDSEAITNVKLFYEDGDYFRTNAWEKSTV